MGLFGKIKAMFSKSTARASESNVSPEVSRAIQRNEMAGMRAQEALEKLRMTDTLRDIAGKMK